MTEVNPTNTETRPSRRWAVLGVYGLAAGLSQFLWLNFAPLISQIQQRFGVSEDQAALLMIVFPLIYVLLSLPAGALIDRHGYRFGVGVGVALMAVFACARVYDKSFWWLVAAQTGIALGQPFVVNGISKLVLDWFEKDEEAIATGIGTVGMFLGMAGALAATPPLVERFGLSGTLGLFAAASVAVAIAFFAVVTPNPRPSSHDEPGVRPGRPDEPTRLEIGALLSDRHLVLLFVLSFLGLGYFNGLTTWLEPILATRGISSVRAGFVGSSLIIGGIVGAATVPAFSDRFCRRKPFLIGSVVAALATLYPLAGASDFSLLLGLGALQGFFFLPAYSIMLEMSAELAGSARAGAATGILMLTGNAGGVMLTMAMQWIKGASPDFAPSIHLLACALAVAIILAVFLRETHPRAHSGIKPSS